jgi:dTDP-4-amino-4,6-dideoxygalactose transaminase
MNIKKILNNLPSYPHYKMNIFSGTNNFFEIKSTFRKLFSKNMVDGHEIVLYEQAIKNIFNAKNIFTFASGRMGFYTILKAIDIKKDDEIIIPSFTCVVVPNAILYSGAKPIYCDIQETDFNIDVSKIEALITSKTRVLYAQHTFGQMSNINKIIEISKKHNLIVIEDVALALGSKIHNQYAGTLGDFGYVSTDRSKIINTGLGGIVFVNNKNYIKNFENIYRNIPYLSETLTKKIAISFIINIITLNPWFYWLGKFINTILSKLKILVYFLDEPFTNKDQISKYPYPARLSNILANIGLSQIQLLNKNLYNRKKIANYYNNILQIYTYDYINSEQNVFLRYSFLIKNRNTWEEKFSKIIDLSIWFKTIASGRNNNFEEINYNIGSNNTSEYVCKHIFNLPTHNQIKPEKLEKLLYELKNSGDIITKEHIL